MLFKTLNKQQLLNRIQFLIIKKSIQQDFLPLKRNFNKTYENQKDYHVFVFFHQYPLIICGLNLYNQKFNFDRYQQNEGFEPQKQQQMTFQLVLLMKTLKLLLYHHVAQIGIELKQQDNFDEYDFYQQGEVETPEGEQFEGDELEQENKKNEVEKIKYRKIQKYHYKNKRHRRAI
ncbi:unnamed protein product [Paramecium primaurelia]|uniref:Uncharacterized protein n=1 Tax=Paramecium primaurelia TaxID=5886 RepID=A0A8S1MBN9_PARPR|nr:unnamed protein product [Paramecium primaurelia]